MTNILKSLLAEAPSNEMNIADIAAKEFVQVEPDEQFGKVRAVFERENPKGIIVTKDGKYRGLITERQLLQSHVSDSTKAEALMRSAPQIDRTTGIRDVSRMLVEGGTKVAPVFEADRLWGIITEDAILQAVLENLDALTVGQIHSDEVVTVSASTTVGRAINLLRENGISRLPVTNEDGHLTGMLTTYDLSDVIIRDMNKQTQGDRAGDIDRILDLPVYDAMNSPVETISTEATVREAVEMMFDYDYAGLVVTPTDDDRIVAGVITKTDVLRAVSYEEEEHLDVQITNIELLDRLSREEVRQSITEVSDKYRQMQVQHAHVRFQQHKERHRGVPLIDCHIRLRTGFGQIAGSGEGFGAEAAFRVALDKLERNVLAKKGVHRDEALKGELLRKLNQL